MKWPGPAARNRLSREKIFENILTHLLLENRSLVDFAIVNEGYCRDRRFCGTDPIFPTQRIPRGRDPILSTQRICQINDVVKNLMGAMHQKIAISKGRNRVCRVHFFQEFSFPILN